MLGQAGGVHYSNTVQHIVHSCCLSATKWRMWSVAYSTKFQRSGISMRFSRSQGCFKTRFGRNWNGSS